MSDWTAFLRPATFAGLSFYVKTSKTKAGQRLIVQEVPYANATLENSGLLPKAFTVTAYFLGSGWLAQWTAFLALLDASTTAQTLVLPTLGPLTVQVGEYSYPFDETIGAYGEIEIEFVVDNSAQAPFANADTASKLLNAIGNLTAQIGAAYQAVMGPIAQAAAIAEYETALLGSAASAVLALPSALLAGVTTLFTSAPTYPATTAAAVTGAFLSISDNAVAQLNPAPSTVDSVTGIVPASAAPADPSLGLAALTAWGADLAPAALYPATLGTAQDAVVALVQQSAGLALAGLYAQTDFSSAQAAQAARAQLTGCMDSIAANIADTGLPDMFRAWVSLSAMAIGDMIARAQSLPSIAPYGFPVALPDVVIAQRLLQDGAKGAAIAQLNNAIHPLFMPMSGIWLQAA